MDITFRTKAFIDGKFVDARSGKTFPTENPATGEILAHVAECDAADVDDAVRAARRAYESGVWSRMAPASRKRVLLKYADLLEKHADELAMLDVLEAGKPITDTKEIDIPETVNSFRWFAEAIDKLYDQIAPTGPEYLALILREPVGVAAGILAWNFPAFLAGWKAAPALAAGNSLVLKPAEQTSLSALRMAELAAEAGVPEGVLNVVPGFGETVGQALGRHMDVDVASFTGSTEVGRMFLQYAAESNLKRIVLECGGKSPQIVMKDARDLKDVAREILAAAFWNMGENCSCGSRLLVHQDLKDALLDEVLALTRELRVGDPLDSATNVGPMIERQHLEKVMSYISAGKEEGASVRLGGRRVLEDTGGYFVEPTIFDGVNNDMKIAREEIFGPVLSVIPFSTEEEAIAIANDTSYGLAASLWSNDVNTINRVSRAIKAGTVSVNCFSEGDITTPFGGYKQSGFGGREKSLYAFDQYTELKTVWIKNW